MKKKEKDLLVNEFQELIPNALKVIKEAVEGKPVNPDRLKTAKFVVNSYKAGRIIDKEDRKVSINERRFNFSVLNNFGSEDQKKQVKELISKSITTIKYLED